MNKCTPIFINYVGKFSVSCSIYVMEILQEKSCYEHANFKVSNIKYSFIVKLKNIIMVFCLIQCVFKHEVSMNIVQCTYNMKTLCLLKGFRRMTAFPY